MSASQSRGLVQAVADLAQRIRRLERRGADWVEEVGGTSAGLYVGTAAPTDGSVFWYDPDETC